MVPRDPSSLISVLARNQNGEVLKAAIKDDDLAANEHNLSAQWAHEFLYGGNVRLFAAECLHKQIAAASLMVIAERGVRVISDYLPPSISRTDEYKSIFELERKLGQRSEFAAIARYTQFLAHRTIQRMKDAI